MTKSHSCAKTVLEKNSIPEPNTGCWLWTGAHQGKGYKKGKGYGCLSFQGQKQIAHRFAWEVHNGPIPSGMHVLHRCDTPCCVNIDHLFLGTNKDNIHDCISKGRRHIMVGQTHARAILTGKDVLAIRASPAGHTELAKLYGVTKHAIFRVRKRLSWTHI